MRLEIVSNKSSLNGYDDVLYLKVLETAQISTIFFATYSQDNQREISL
jgi:hypothetical protein